MMRVERTDGTDCLPDCRRHYLVGLDRDEARLVRRVLMTVPRHRWDHVVRLLSVVFRQLLEAMVVEDKAPAPAAKHDRYMT